MRSQNLVNLVLVLALALATVVCSKEVDALYIWKNQLEDPNNVLSSWDPTASANPCAWFRVTCNEDNFVTTIILANSGLSGPLFPQLADLSNLQYLVVFGNKLNGSIPSEIGTLKKLIALDLSNNNLSGSIPPSFGNLTSLQILRLNSNKLTGKVPEQVKQLQEWGNLRIINVTDNFLEAETTSTVVTNVATNYKKHVAQLLLITCFYTLYFASIDS